MRDFLTNHYLILKALHLICMVAWMAGLFYLPRLFVYHSTTVVGSETSEMLKVMEYRLARIIMLPASLLTLLFGGALMGVPGLLSPPCGWFHIKLFSVILLFAFHGFLINCMKAFKVDKRRYSKKFYIVLNEIPTILLITVVFMVVLKPF